VSDASKMVPAAGFEPTIARGREAQARLSAGRFDERSGAAELSDVILVPAAGFEPTTSWFEARRSIQLSYAGEYVVIRSKIEGSRLYFPAPHWHSAAKLSYAGRYGL
jgi:hypothetical protein